MNTDLASARHRLARAPESTGSWRDVAMALDRAGQHEDAAAADIEALRLAPDDPHLAARANRALAERHLRGQLAHQPSLLAARLALAERLRARHRPSAARDILRSAPKEAMNDAELLAALAVTELELGHQETARRLAEQAVEREPRGASFHQLLCNTMAYQDAVTGAELTAALRRCAALWPRAPDRKRRPEPPDPNRRIRVGVLGGAFRRHPSSWLTIAAFEHLDRDSFEIHCFATPDMGDAFTARWQAIATGWHTDGSGDYPSIDASIRGAGIDILIDIGGALDNGRLPVLALRPAPVQVKWVGAQYHTTGYSEVDAFITDRFETPPDLAHLYVEKLVVMPGSYICYDLPRHAPDVTDLPARRGHGVVFGSFNNLMKITPRVLDTWSAILRRVTRSRLLLMAPQFEENAVRDAVRAEFAVRGVDDLRIEFAGESDHHGILAAYGRVDIALQPFPYGGGVTLLEGIFMGVPGVTLAGETFASRHGVSHLSHVGLTDCIAETPDDYVDRAVTLAFGLPRLAELRRQMRDRLRSSPICAAAAFARHFGDALRVLHAGR